MASNSKTKKRPKIDAPKVIVPAAPAPAPELNNDFEKVVQESKNKLHNEKLQPLKRGRGRPASTKPTDTAHTVSAGPTLTATGHMPVPPPNLTEYMVLPLQMISKIPARKYKIDDLALTVDEAALIAKSLNDCMNAFIPDLSTMSPKTAAVVGVFVTIGSIGANKYMVYADQMTVINSEIEKQNKVLPPEPPISNDRISAFDAFSVQRPLSL